MLNPAPALPLPFLFQTLHRPCFLGHSILLSLLLLHFFDEASNTPPPFFSKNVTTATLSLQFFPFKIIVCHATTLVFFRAFLRLPLFLSPTISFLISTPLVATVYFSACNGDPSPSHTGTEEDEGGQVIKTCTDAQVI